MASLRISRALAGASVALLLAAGTPVGFSAAQSVPPPPVVSTEIDRSGQIDMNRKGSIEIFKRVNPQTVGGPATGNETDGVSGQPLAGVRYSVYRAVKPLDRSYREDLPKDAAGANSVDLTRDNSVDLTRPEPYDLSRPEDWAALSALAGGEGVQTLTPDKLFVGGEAIAEGYTDYKGHLKFEGLAPGVYVVVEDPAAVTPEQKAAVGLATNARTLGGAPFIVFLPGLAPKADKPNVREWDYDVTVYPKNTSAGIDKAVFDAGKNAGDVISYKIDADVPQPMVNELLTKFEVVDLLPDELNPGGQDWPASVTVRALSSDQAAAAVTADDLKTSGSEVDPKNHFTTTFNSETRELKVSFTDVGLKWLADNDPAKIRVVVDAKLTAIGDGDGEVSNTAQLITRQPGSDSDTVVVSPVVNTYLGKLQVIKHEKLPADSAADATAENRRLAGATFELYRSAADDKREKITIAMADGRQVSQWTTNENGELLIDGLSVTDFDNNSPVAQPVTYWLKEVEAPAGYVLPKGDDAFTEVHFTRFDLLEGQIPGGEQGQVNAVKSLTKSVAIANTRSEVPELPLTGGQGIILLVVIGGALGGAAIYVARRNNVKAQA